MAATTAPDSALLARLAAGDDLAFGQVYDRYSGFVFRVAQCVIRDEQLAGDVTQEVFVQLWEQPGRVDLERGSLRTYLGTVARRRAVDEVRRLERRRRREVDHALPELIGGPEDEVVGATTAQWRRRRLLDGLAMLPDEQRRALVLAYCAGLSYRDVARELGLPEGTAKSRLRLALGRLRSLLGEDVRAVIT